MEDGGGTKSVEPVVIHDTEAGGGGAGQSGTGTDNRKTVDRSWLWAAVLSVWETIKNVRTRRRRRRARARVPAARDAAPRWWPVAVRVRR